MKKGFTLIELIIYVGILAIVSGFLTSILVVTTKVQNQQVSAYEVGSQLNFALNYIQRVTRESSNIEMEAGKSLSYLRLRTQDPQKDPTIIALAANQIEIKEGGNASTTLTSDKVLVDALNFTKYANYPGHDSIQIGLTLSYNTSNPNFAFSKTLSSAIGRVSAATFDDNLIPGIGNTHDLGTQSTPWRKGWFNQLCLGGNCITSWPSGGGGGGIVDWADITNRPAGLDNGDDVGFLGGGTQNYLSKFTDPGTIGNSQIFDNGTNVGVATGTPGAKLAVAGNTVIGGNLSITGTLDVQGACPICSQWVTSGSNIYYNAGNVGIGTTSPARALHVGTVGFRLTPGALPASPAAGDIAVDSADSNRLKWYDGATWRTSAPTICTWSSKTYSTGAICQSQATACIYNSNTQFRYEEQQCLSSGAWQNNGWIQRLCGGTLPVVCGQ